MKSDTCSKCSGELEKGMIKGSGAYAGLPQWGTTVDFWGNVKNGKDVATYRCKNCGYLESYTI